MGARLIKFLAIVITFFAAAAVRADGLIVIIRPPIVVPGHFTFAPLEVKYHHVDCTIDDQVAVTTVDQVFVNPNSMRLEGDYIFPLPEGAQINKFSMDIDGKQVEAELLSADKARRIYEEIVRREKDPALLEYAGRAMFKVHIFPIEPNSTKRVQLKYTELLKMDNNLMDYHYTLNTEKFSSRPLQNVAIKVAIKSTEPLTTLYSPTHAVEIKRADDRTAVVGYEANDVRPDTDFHLYIGHKAAAVGFSLLTYKPDPDRDGYFVLMAAPIFGKDSATMKKDVVFVMDTSGSMAGPKIQQARKALKYCVNSLNKDDRFDIVRFSTEADPLFKGLADATDANRKKATDFVEGMQASGGTAIDEALHAAFDERPGDGDRLFLIVFITDGEPTVGEQDPDRLVAKVKENSHAKNVRIFSFGVGNDVNTKLLDLIAQQTRGYSQYVLPTEDIEVSVSNFFNRVQDPVLTDVGLDTGNIRIAKMYPKELPDLFKGDQLVAFGTYSKGGSTAVSITGSTCGNKEKFIQDVTFSDKTDNTNEWIGKLWAVRRVGYLLDEIRLHGEDKELKDEVTELARRFGIVTPYTAMLIIEDEKRRNVAAGDRTLGEMESDSFALSNASGGIRTLREHAQTGGQAVANSINGNAYKDASSLDGVKQLAEQSASRYYFEGQSGGALAKAAAAPAAVATPAYGGRGGAVTVQPPAQTEQGYRTTGNYAQQNRVINGRAFYQNGNNWSDARIQQLPADAKHVKIKFNSDDYFDLLQKHPTAAAWFSLGNNLSIELDGVVYDVTD
jgi:Ca-activated chloride channel homolog